MFSPFLPSQRSGRFCRSATPDACGPRNDGQLPASGAAGRQRRRMAPRPFARSGARDEPRPRVDRSPLAAIENHSPRRARVVDDGESHVRARRRERRSGRPCRIRPACPASAAATCAPSCCPGSLERRPPVALEHERPVGDKTGMEGAERQLTTRQRGLRGHGGPARRAWTRTAPRRRRRRALAAAS